MDGSSIRAIIVLQLNKKGLTRNPRQGRQTPWKILNPAFSLSSKGHIWKRVWGRKAQLARGSVSLTLRRDYPVVFICMDREMHHGKFSWGGVLGLLFIFLVFFIGAYVGKGQELDPLDETAKLVSCEGMSDAFLTHLGYKDRKECQDVAMVLHDEASSQCEKNLGRSEGLSQTEYTRLHERCTYYLLEAELGIPHTKEFMLFQDGKFTVIQDPPAGDYYDEMAKDAAVNTYKDTVAAVGDPKFTTYVADVLGKRCPVYEPSGALWRECLTTVRDESKTKYQKRGSSIDGIESRCQAIGDKYDGLVAGEVILSCESYYFSGLGQL